MNTHSVLSFVVNFKYLTQFWHITFSCRHKILPISIRWSRNQDGYQQKWEKITSEILQPTISESQSKVATTDVFKNNKKASLWYKELYEQAYKALEKKGKELAELISWKEKSIEKEWKTIETTVNDRITNIANIVKSRIYSAWKWWIEKLDEYKSKKLEIDNLTEKAKKYWLTNTEKQRLKRLFDDEIDNLYDKKWDIKWDKAEVKALEEERQFLRKEIEIGSWLPNEWEAVRVANTEYASLKKAVNKLEQLKQLVENSKSVPNWIKLYFSKFAKWSFLREVWVKWIAYHEKELSSKINQLEKYSKAKDVYKTKLSQIKTEKPWKEIKSVAWLPLKNVTTNINTNIVWWEKIYGTNIWNVRKWQIIEWK